MKKTLFTVLLWTQFSSASVSSWVQAYVKESESIQVAQKQKYATAEMKKEAKTKFFPSVSLEGAYVEQEVPRALTGGFDVSPDHVYDAGIVVEQPLFLGGRIWAGVRQRKAEAARAEGEYLNSKNAAISQFLELLFNKGRADQTRLVLEKSQKRLNEFVGATRKRSRLGNARSYELAQAQSNALSYQPRLTALHLQSVNIVTQIDALIVPDRQPQQLNNLFLSLDQIQAKMQIAAPSWDQHPDWRVAEQQQKMAEAAKSLAMGEHYPTFAVKGKWGYRAIEKDQLGEPESKATEVSLGVTIPLFSGLSSLYVRRSQQALVQAAELNKELTRRSLDAERKATSAAMQSYVEQMQSVLQWKMNAEKALRLGLKNYQLGVIDNFQVVSLQQGMESAETTYIETLYQLNLSFKSWCVARGWDLEAIYSDSKL